MAVRVCSWVYPCVCRFCEKVIKKNKKSHGNWKKNNRKRSVLSELEFIYICNMLLVNVFVFYQSICVFNICVLKGSVPGSLCKSLISAGIGLVDIVILYPY